MPTRQFNLKKSPQCQYACLLGSLDVMNSRTDATGMSLATSQNLKKLEAFSESRVA